MPSNDLPPEPDPRAVPLLRAYFDAVYEVASPLLRLRIGRRAPSLERAWPRARNFALIGAWNPDSHRRSDAFNRTQQRALDTALCESAAAWTAACNAASNGEWAEEARLVTDLDLARLDALAMAFGQIATLAWTRGRAVRLRVYRPDWRRAARAACVDTRFVDWVACAPP